MRFTHSIYSQPIYSATIITGAMAKLRMHVIKILVRQPPDRFGSPSITGRSSVAQIRLICTLLPVFFLNAKCR